MNACKKPNNFDSFSDSYLGGMENPIKKLFGKGLADFVGIKARWLTDRLEKSPLKGTIFPRLLDYGCGDGVFIEALQKLEFLGKLEGCDVSKKMLGEAHARLDAGGNTPPLHLIEEGKKLPFENGAFDVVIACCVLHHIDPEKRPAIFRELTRVTKPGGRIVIFEHNLFNPLTQIIIKTTAIDKDASLVAAKEIRRLMRSNNLANIITEHILLVPPSFRWPWLQRIEQILSFLPLGSQYVIVGEKTVNDK